MLFASPFNYVSFSRVLGEGGLMGFITFRGSSVTAALLGCAMLAACSTRATTTGTYVPPATAAVAALPRPMVVVVGDFATDASAVRVDRGIGGTLRRTLSGTSANSTQTRDAAAVQLGITDALMQAIRDMGLPVQEAGGPPPVLPYVQVRGRVTSIDEGNRTRRTAVGFGAGQSNVRATAEVLYVPPGAEPRLLQTYEASSDSGHMPGLTVGAASAAAGHTAAAAANGGMNLTNAGHADVSAEAKRLGERMAVNVGKLFAEQGWIPQSAVPRPKLR